MKISNENIHEWYKEVNPNSPFQFTSKFGLQKSIDGESENILPIDIFNQIIDDKIINECSTQNKKKRPRNVHFATKFFVYFATI
ncbi:hypothetical protein A3Q56_00118 [Intoshia linei]|uniref:Uncharacterized protein n=1 Tax=Intoshia linei TaxID=1819745 RepID=A0A177BEK3_9BILA|nr:hypothetical protein A3Q56_00118 [Intoshia linei]